MMSVCVVDCCVGDIWFKLVGYEDVVYASALFVSPSCDVWGVRVEVGYDGYVCCWVCCEFCDEEVFWGWVACGADGLVCGFGCM